MTSPHGEGEEDLRVAEQAQLQRRLTALLTVIMGRLTHESARPALQAFVDACLSHEADRLRVDLIRHRAALIELAWMPYGAGFGCRMCGGMGGTKEQIVHKEGCVLRE